MDDHDHQVITGCVCPDDGSDEERWCERHQCRKPAHFRMLCRTRPEYYQAWEEGRGPGQQPPTPSRGLGDTIARVTTVAGIRPCSGCKRRQQVLNEMFPYGRRPRATVTRKLLAISVGVCTSPRPKGSLLGRCLTSLADAGFSDVTVFAEPSSDLSMVGNHVEVVHRRKRYGEWRNRVYAMQWMTFSRPSADAVLMVEDDVVFCRRVCKWLGQTLWPSPKCGAVYVYTSHWYKDRLPIGVTKLSKGLMSGIPGACAVAFSPPAVADVLAYAARKGWRGRTKGRARTAAEKAATDTFYGVALRATGWEAWLHNPSLAEHIAEVSSQRHGGAEGKRHALGFPGEDADPFAMQYGRIGKARYLIHYE